MSKIDIDRFISDLIEYGCSPYGEKDYLLALQQQALDFQDGELVEMEEIIGKEENVSPIPPLTDEKKSISQIQHAQACADKDLGMSPYVEGVIPNIDEQNILMSSCTFTKENNKPKTIKFNESEKFDSVWPKEVVDELLEETQKNTPKVKEELKKYFSNVFPTIYDIDIDKMVEEYKEEESKVLLPLGFSKGNIEHLSIAYKNGIEDTLKLIKEGGEAVECLLEEYEDIHELLCRISDALTSKKYD